MDKSLMLFPLEFDVSEEGESERVGLQATSGEKQALKAAGTLN